MKLWRQPLDRDRLASPRGHVQISSAWCKGCQFCVVFCPTGVLELSSDFNAKGYHYPRVKNSEGCIDCKLCERLCPEYSIVVTSLPTRLPTRPAAAPAAAAEDGQQPAAQA